jgi:hypothetical protein
MSEPKTRVVSADLINDFMVLFSCMEVEWILENGNPPRGYHFFIA